MATPNGAEHRDLEQRLRNLEQDVRELTGAALYRRQLSVDQGDFVVSGGGSVIVRDAGDLRILDEEGAVVFSAANGPVRTAHAQVSNASDTFDTAWATRVSTNVAVPVGYTFAIVQMFVSVGASMSGTTAGNVGVQPVVAGNPGVALSMGKTGGGAVSVAAGQAIRVPVTPGGTLSLSASGYANGGPVIAGSCNAHLSATVIFTRA